MRPILLTLLLASAALLAGCAAPGGGDPDGNETGNVPPQGLAQPVAVFEGTLDFSEDPTGAERSEALTVQAGARQLNLTGVWRSQTPLMTTNEVFVEVRDSSGAVVAKCDMDQGGITDPVECGPTSMDVRAGETYTLAWGGFGNVELDLTIEAS